MMYFLFRYKKWEPAVYFDAPDSDKRLIRVFMRRELAEREKELEELAKV